MPPRKQKSTPLNKLTRAEARAYRQWCASVRQVQENRNAVINASTDDGREKVALYQFSLMAMQREFEQWQTIASVMGDVTFMQTHANDTPRA